MGKAAGYEIVTEDLSVDDLVLRHRMAAFFRAEFDRRKEREEDVSRRVGRGQNWFFSTLKNDQWRVSTVQRVARAFGHELLFEVVFPARIKDRFPVESLWPESRAFAHHSDPHFRDDIRISDLLRLGARVREALGLSTAQLAQRLSVAGSKLTAWERADQTQVLLPLVQRYFRAMDAPLVIGLDVPAIDGEDDEPIFMPFPVTRTERPVAAAWLKRNELIVEDDGSGDILLWNALRPNERVRVPRSVWLTYPMAHAGGV